MSVTINEGSQTDIYTVVNGGTEVQVIKLDIGSGTALQDFGGTILAVNSVANVVKGTITSVEGLPDPLGSVTMTVGTITTGSLANVAMLHAGTVSNVGSVANIGVIHNAGTVAALPDPLGSVVMTAGTVSAIPQISVGTLPTLNIASLPDLAGGTIDLVSQANVTVGTFSADIPGGTIDAVTNVAGGTVVTDTLSYRFADEFATTVSTGTSTLGTIKPAVSGSVIYVTDIKISVNAPTNVEIASGGTSTPIIGTLFFAGSAGMVANYRVPVRTASGSALVYKQSSDTGMTIDVQGYVN